MTVPAQPSVLPRWTRAADLACVLILLVAAIVAMSGGFRVRFGDWRIALTSPLRLLLWAVGIAVARHAIAPARPIYRDLPPRLAEWARSRSTQLAGTVVFGTRPAILLVGYLAVFVIGYEGGHAPLRHFDNELLNLPVRWDAGWYLQIVTDGYSFDLSHPEEQQNIVFFPAYPVAVRLVGRLLGGELTGFVLAGVIVSLTSFFCALLYLYAFAREQLDEDQASFALWLLAAYPFALFFGAVCTESLFLLSVIGSFYHFSKRQFWQAALWGVLVGLTKMNGFLLCVPLGILAIAGWLPPLLVGGRGDTDRMPIAKALAVAATPLVGLLIYTAFVWRLTGDPLIWFTGHAAWGRKYVGLSALVAARVDLIANAGLYGYTSQSPYDFINALGAVFVLAAVWPVARRLGLAYAVFILINILPPLSDGGLMSVGRFSSVMFPAFVWVASVVPARQRQGWLASFAALQALNAALFYTWRPLY